MVRRTVQDLLQGADNTQRGAHAAREVQRVRLVAPVPALAGSLGCASQRSAQHDGVSAQCERLHHVTGAAQGAVSDHVYVAAAGLIQVVRTCRSHVGDSGCHGCGDAQALAGGLCGTAAEAHQHAGCAGTHQVLSLRVASNATNDDRNVELVDELLQVQRLVRGGNVLSRDGRATDDEQLNARLHHGLVVLLGVLRTQGACNDHAGVTNLFQACSDQFRLNRLGVNLLHAGGCGGGVRLGQLNNLVEQRLRVLVAGPQALEVQHAQATQLTQRNGGRRGHDRVHGRTNDGGVELEGVNLPGGVDVAAVAGTAGRHQRHIVQGVGGAGFLGEANLNFRHGVNPFEFGLRGAAGRYSRRCPPDT